MPRRQGRGGRVQRGGSTASRQKQNEDDNDASNSRGRQTRGRQTRGRQTRGRQTNQQVNESSAPSSERPRRQTGRPVTISLDVTFSSEDEDDLPLTPSPPPANKFDDIVFALTPSPPSSPQRRTKNDLYSEVKPIAENGIKNTAGKNSDDDSDSPVCSSPLPKKFKSEIPVYDGNSSSDDDDPFAIDFQATKKKAMENACRDFEIIEKEERTKKKLEEKLSDERKEKEEILPAVAPVQPVLEVIDESSNETEKENKNILKNTDFFSQLGISPIDIKSPSNKKIKVNRKTKKALDQFQELRNSNLQEKFNVTDDHENDCLIVSDEEEDTNAEQTIRIRWGQDTFKYTLRRLQKLSVIYQQLAEKYSVSVNKVLLLCRDKILSPESCPADLGITAADFLEGGIQKDSQENSNTADANEDNPDNIELKVQNANTKGSVKLFISKYDKMSMLMHKYAEEMGKTVKQFKFVFDGERLQINDTPESLDLDGGECIDVYEV